MMKKLTLMLLVIQSGFMMAQTKTFVTVNGERVQINPNSVNTANNGLEAQNGNVQLGGALIKKTTLVTTPSNTLALQGLQNGTNKDSVLVADSAGVLKLVPRSVFNTEGDNLGNHTATQNINLDSNFINSDGKDWGLMFNNSTKNAWFEGTNISARADYVVRGDGRNAFSGLNFIVQTGNNGPFETFGYNEVLSEASNFVIPQLDLSNLNDYKTFADYYTNTYGTVAPDLSLVFNTNDNLTEDSRGKGLYYALGNSTTNRTWEKIGDDLGNHKATQNINLGTNVINADGVDNWGLVFMKGTAKSAFFKETQIAARANYADRTGTRKIRQLDLLTQIGDNGFFEKVAYDQILDETGNFAIPNLNLSSLSDYKTYSDYYSDNYNGIIPNSGLVFNMNDEIMPNGKGIGLYHATQTSENNNRWVKVGDDLGDHKAIQDLNMNSKNITGAANITATGTVYADNLTATTKTTTPKLQVTNGAGAGKLAVSDASGNLIWTNASLEGLLVYTKTYPIGNYNEIPYPLNVSTTLEASNQSITIDKKSRVVISGAAEIGVKSNTMGCGYIIVKMNGSLMVGYSSKVKYSVYNPVNDGFHDIFPDASLTTHVSFEAVIDDLEPGTYQFSVDIKPTWSAPVTEGDYVPEHFTTAANYMTFKIYNK